MKVSIDQIQQGILQNQDFISSLNNDLEVAVLLSSFANSSGGVLWFGVKPTGKIIGVSPEEVQSLVLEACDLLTNPIEISFDTLVVGMKLVVAVQVKECSIKPVSVLLASDQKVAYFRVGGKCMEANKIMLNVWKMHQSIQSNVQLEDFDREVLGFVQSNQPLTLSQLYKKFPKQFKEVDHSLSRLIYLKSLDMVDIHGNICFQTSI